jgi:hypothetical protein
MDKMHNSHPAFDHELPTIATGCINSETIGEKVTQQYTKWRSQRLDFSTLLELHIALMPPLHKVALLDPQDTITEPSAQLWRRSKAETTYRIKSVPRMPHNPTSSSPNKSNQPTTV